MEITSSLPDTPVLEEKKHKTVITKRLWTIKPQRWPVWMQSAISPARTHIEIIAACPL